MEPRTNERIPVTSSEESLNNYLDGSKTDARKTGSRRLRACPVMALLALFVHMISSGCGIALSALIVRYGLDMTSAGILNLVARILLFAASCMGPFYVFMHLVAAREHYVRSLQNGTPQIFGYVSVAVAVLVMRLGLPIWIAAVVLSALVAAQKGFDTTLGFSGNVVWVQLGVAALALSVFSACSIGCLPTTLTRILTRLSLIILVIVTETTDRPFATSIFSRRSFIKGTDMMEDRRDTFDLSISQQGHRPGDTRTRTGATGEELKQASFDRSMINSPESPEAASSPDDYSWEASQQRPSQRQPSLRYDRPQRRENFRYDRPQRQDTLRYDRPRRQDTAREYQPQRQETLRYERPRSQYLPQPLESVYAVESIPPDAQESPRQNGSHFSWRPPTRDSTYSQQRPRHEDEASSMPMARISFTEPASQPPSMPLPPMPPREMPDELAMPISPPPPAFTQERPATASEPDVPTSDPNAPGAPVPPEAQAAPPSIAQLLSALSTRAAARRRNSLVVRQADLAPRRQSIDIAQSTSNTNSNMTAMLFQQPEEDELVEIPRPTTTPRDLLSENGEPLALRAHPLRRSSTASGMIPVVYQQPEELEEDESVMMRGPATAPRGLQSDDDDQRGRPLQRSNTDTSRLVMNFSRPRLPGIGGEDDEDADADADFETEAGQSNVVEVRTRAGGRNAGADRPRRRGAHQDRAVRRSRSLSTLADRPRPLNTLVEVSSPSGDASSPGAEVRPGTAGEREKPARAPRFSPFPKLPDSDRKIKGLGQGSTRRRDDRIARWREEVSSEEADEPAVTRSNDARDLVGGRRGGE